MTYPPDARVLGLMLGFEFVDDLSALGMALEQPDMKVLLFLGMVQLFGKVMQVLQHALQAGRVGRVARFAGQPGQVAHAVDDHGHGPVFITDQGHGLIGV
jgi:hypothetical protein